MNFSNLAIALAVATIGAGALTPAAGRTDSSRPKLRKVTFAGDVASILYNKCARCHHDGEVAPFSLMSYTDAKDRAKTIAAVTGQRYMPPWQADSHGEFTNERKLTSAEIETLQLWAAQGAPEGKAAAEPPAPTFTPGWQLGKPDFVGESSKPYAVSPDGDDVYRCFVIPTHFDTGRYVTGVELRPGNHRVVHHVLVYIDTSGAARKRDGEDGSPGYASFGGPGFVPTGALGGWVPGLDPQVSDKGAGMWLPKGADIVMQVHYHKDGKSETDQTKIGLYFAKAPIDKRIRFGAVDNPIISIPPGDPNYEVQAGLTVPANVTVTDVIPHMHWLGHDMTVTATLPDGSVRQLIKVEHYDFNWQTRYTYKQPVELPKGTKISLVAHYDNSAANPHNPNSPPRRVHFGEQTTDEMCFAFFTYTVDAEHIITGHPIGEGALGSDTLSGVIDKIFDRFDENHDGFLDEKELIAVIKFFQDSGPKAAAFDPAVAAKFLLATYDKGKKGKLNRDEFRSLANGVERAAGKVS